MEYLSSSSSNSMILTPSYHQNNDQQIILQGLPYDHAPYSTQLQSQVDPMVHIMPPHHLDDGDGDDELDHLLNLQIIHPSIFLDLEENNNQGGNDNNECSNKQGKKKHIDDNDNDGDGDGDVDGKIQNEKKKKQRIQHREIERQRRLEMSSLHATLRSLLPLEYIKGKRSMSEHFNETVKYIKHLQQRIQALTNQRDALKSGPSIHNKSNGCDGNSNNGNGDFEVKVNPSNNGGNLEVIVSTYDSQVLPLSRVLQCLINQGLEVVTCISTTNNNTLIHSIQAQVEDGKSISIDAVKLKQILAETP